MDFTFLAQNECVAGSLLKDYDNKIPELYEINNIIAKIPSSLHYADGNFNNLSEFKKMMVSYPKLNMLGTSVMFNDRFLAGNLVATSMQACLSGYDCRHGRFLNCHFGFKGIQNNLVQKQTNGFRDKNSSYFVPTCKSVTAGFSNKVVVDLENKPNSGLGQVINVNNSTANAENLKRLSEKFTCQFRRKSFLHHFTQEGLDEMQMAEAESSSNDKVTLYEQYQDAE